MCSIFPTGEKKAQCLSRLRRSDGTLQQNVVAGELSRRSICSEEVKSPQLG